MIGSVFVATGAYVSGSSPWRYLLVINCGGDALTYIPLMVPLNAITSTHLPDLTVNNYKYDLNAWNLFTSSHDSIYIKMQ